MEDEIVQLVEITEVAFNAYLSVLKLLKEGPDKADLEDQVRCQLSSLFSPTDNIMPAMMEYLEEGKGKEQTCGHIVTIHDIDEGTGGNMVCKYCRIPVSAAEVDAVLLKEDIVDGTHRHVPTHETDRGPRPPVQPDVEDGPSLIRKAHPHRDRSKKSLFIGMKLLMEGYIEGLQVSSLQCPVCYMVHAPQEMLYFFCGCVFCPQCIKDYVESMIEQNKIHDEGLFCPLCQTPIDKTMLEAIISPEAFHRFNMLLIKRLYNIVTCRICNSQFECDATTVRCPSCAYQFCTKCLLDLHKGPCNDSDESTTTRCKMFEDAGVVFSQCPKCLTPYDKDEGCQHVKCVQPDCGIDFCYKCSAIRSPILAHGNHYHRPACPYFSMYNGVNTQHPDCAECMASQGVCMPPLDTPRLGKFF